MPSSLKLMNYEFKIINKIDFIRLHNLCLVLTHKGLKTYFHLCGEISVVRITADVSLSLVEDDFLDFLQCRGIF